MSRFAGGPFLHHDGLSRPLEAPRLRILSLGAGVQSTVLALMAKHGELGPMPDLAIFADTQAEPGFVYEHLDWLEGVLPFPIHRVTAGNLEADLHRGFAGLGRYASIPAFVPGADGRPALVRRQCTKEYKLGPITAETRRLLGLAPRKRGPRLPVVEAWIGISTDEIVRVRPADKSYIHNRHPLIEARMSRRDCEAWLRERQYQLPLKSACVFCPFKDNAEWRLLRDHAPDDFARAVRLDRAIRSGNANKGLRAGVMALHRSLRPLDTVNFEVADRGDGLGFANDCHGMCGV